MTRHAVDDEIAEPSPLVGFNRATDDLKDLLAGSNIGLALFGADLTLVQCNDRYREFFNYRPEEAQAGAALADLIRLKLQRRKTSADQIERLINSALAQIKPGKDQTFHFETSTNRQLLVTRCCLENGRLVESVVEANDSTPTRQLATSAEQFATVARERMTHALEVMADGFALYDAEDRLVMYNKKYVDLNPHIADLIAPGASFEAMLRTGIERAGFNFGSMSYDAFLAWRLEEHRNPGAAYDVQLADGRWIRTHEQRTDDGGTVGIRSDITELKTREAEILRMTQELRRKNIQFDTALNNMIQGLCMFDDNQTLVVCNRRYLEMYGFDPEIVKPGITLPEIMEYSVSIGNYAMEDAAEAVSARPTHAKLRETATLKQYLRDGRVIAVMHQPMPDGGSIATYQDITDLERHQEQLRDYTRRLEVSNRELQDFARVASHDLQEPLRKIEAFGSRLATKFADTLSDEAQMYIDRMQNASSRMRRLIDDMLNFSRVTTKAQPFKSTDLNEIIAGVISDLQISIEESEAELAVDRLPTIDADSTQMRQLFQNLLGNALKFRKPGRKPMIQVKAEIIKDTSDPEGTSTCQLEFIDNGIGFEDKYSDQIFTIFQRLHGKSEFEGTGIGLATCRKIAERHGGGIQSTGRPDAGATFVVTLPLDQENNEE